MCSLRQLKALERTTPTKRGKTSDLMSKHSDSARIACAFHVLVPDSYPVIFIQRGERCVSRKGAQGEMGEIILCSSTSRASLPLPCAI